MQMQGRSRTADRLVGRRGGCLTALLTFVLVVNLFTGLYYSVFFAQAGLIGGTGIRPWVIPLLIVASFANVLFAVAMWRLKRWGLYGYVVSVVVAFAANYVQSPTTGILALVVSLSLLAIAVRPAWRYMS